MRLLILGGTTEASALASQIADRADLQPILSLAGRTRNPSLPPIPVRIGGFGGASALKTYLRANGIEAVIDATHPFAARISQNAATACGDLGVPIAGLTRPPWRSQPGDRWTSVPDLAAAVRALGHRSQRVFLTVGGLHLADFAQAPHHHYLVRSIDPPEAIDALPSRRLILGRGPFRIDNEIALMRDAQIDTLVTKNSGGAATEAKIAAARALGIDIIIIDRPPPQSYAAFDTIDAVLAWIEAHRPVP